MPSVDERIVLMKFENASFESKLGQTIVSLDKLRQSLDFSASKKSMQDLNDAGKAFDISSMSHGVDFIASKFTALGAIGFSVIQKLTQGFMGFAADMVNMAKTDILGPIITGGRQRALNIEQAQFMFRGLGIDVQAGMDSALNAVRGTAFGLDEAAKAAAQFGASGIKVGDDMTGALRGVAGAAAMTGSSFTEIADIFAGVAGTGKLTNQDLMQFATRGLNAAAALGKQMGKSEAQIHEMATNGEIDFGTFAKAMDDAFGKHSQEANQTYAGSLANVHAAMSRLGASFIAPRLTQMRDIFNALSPVIDNFAAALKPVINVLTWFGAIGSQKVVDFLNKLDFSNINLAMPNFAAAIANAFQGVGQVIDTVKSAFRDIFPKQDVSILVKFSEAVRAFSEHLKMGGETIDKVKSIFRGFFSVIDIGWTILKEIIHLIGGLISTISPAGGQFLNIAAAGGDFLTKMDQLLVKEGGIHKFFENLGNVIKQPIVFINELRDKIIALWEAFTGKGGAGPDIAAQGFERVDSRIQQLKDTADKVGQAWDTLKERLSSIKGVFDDVWNYIKNWFSTLGQKLAAAFQPGDFNAAVDIVNVGLLGGIAFYLRKFFKEGLKIDTSGLTNLLDTIKTNVTDTFGALQSKLKADALIKIAGAIGIVTASLLVLSLIDSAALTKALGAMAVGFGQLATVMIVLDKNVGSGAKMGAIAGSMVAMALAMLILSAAIANMARLDWNGLAKGLVGVGGGLAIMVIGLKFITTDVGGLIRAGLAMILISSGLYILSKAISTLAALSWKELAVGLVGVGVGLAAITIALNNMPAGGAISGIGFIEVAVGLSILAGVMKIFASMSWGDIAKGLVGVGVGLALVTTALNFMPASSVISGLGFIEVAIGLNILYTAVKLFSGLGWAEMLKGLVGIGGSLLIVAGAMQLMPLTLPITALGLIMVAGAITVMAGAVLLMGNADLGTLAKGVGALAAVMIILAIGVNAMDGALPGAAALVVVAGALTILAGVIKTLGELKISDILKGLGAIAGVLIVLGLAALIMEPIIPALMGLGIAIALVGAGFTLFGLGAYYVARALQAMAESGVAGAKAFVESIKIMITAIPGIIKAVGQAIIGSAEELLAAVPLLVRLITAILDQLLDTIIQLLPKVLVVIGMLIGGILKLIRDHFPEYVQTGLEMLMSLLKGIRDNIGEIVTLVADIITNFIDALSEKVPEIADSVYNFIITVAEEVARKAGEIQTAFIPIGQAFIEGLLSGLEQNLPFVATFFTEIIPKVLGWIGDTAHTLFSKGWDFISGLFTGLLQKEVDVYTWFIGLPGRVIIWIGDTMGTLFSKGWDLITGLFNGILNKTMELAGWLIGLGGRVFGWVGDLFNTLRQTGWDLIVGFSQGAENKLIELINWFRGFGNAIYGAVGDLFRTLWQTGYDIIDGLWNGMKSAWDHVTGWLENLNPLSHFNDIAPKPGHADKNLYGIGKEVMYGLQDGMQEGWSSVTDWLSSLNPAEHIPDTSGQLAIGFQKSLTDMISGLPNLDEFNPVITPVLDLTNVKAQAKELTSLVSTATITPTVSVGTAQVIATTGQIATPIPIAPVEPKGPQTVSFEQNIYSPEALSTNDIYRSTKSQITLAKEELGIT
jgi:tape measure domain-containing protein